MHPRLSCRRARQSIQAGRYDVHAVVCAAYGGNLAMVRTHDSPALVTSAAYNEQSESLTFADRPLLWMIVAVALTASAGVANDVEPGPFPSGPLLSNSTVWLPSAFDKYPENDTVPEVQDRVVVVGSQEIPSDGFAAPPGATRIALATRAKSVPSVSLFMAVPLNSLAGGRSPSHSERNPK